MGAVAGRFEIVGLAGEGAMARVYKARDLERDTVVALKIAPDNEHLPRFTEEAAALASLDHPALVRYIAHGSIDAGAYLAMDWVEGESLAQRLQRAPLTPEEAVDLGARVGRALGIAHAHGVLHRDVKPSNVMLRDGDLAQPVLVDFGLALRPGRPELTATGIVVGTLGYMSPEQVRGEKKLDSRADVFSLGCVLFRALTGRAPFVGNEPLAILAKILLEPTPRVRDFLEAASDDLDSAIAQLMSPTPEERPRDGTAAAEMLEKVSLARPSIRGRARSIGSAERRIVSVIVVGAEESGRASDDSSSEIQLALQSCDARVEPLGSGALVAMLTGSAMDQALRAGRAALELRRRFPRVAIALASGHEDVAAGIPVGPTIDRAVRALEDISRVGVRIDETTSELVDARFEVTADESGMRLIGERPMLVSRKLLGKETPFVGRDREIALLSAAAHESFNDRAAVCALVTGAPGTGKSRLRHELFARMKRETPDAGVWIARGDPLRAGSPFDIAGQLVCDAADSHDAGDARRAAIARLTARHFSARDAGRISEFLAEIAGAPALGEVSAELRAARRDHELMRDQIRRAWLELLAAETRAGPRLLLIDDLHWGELASVRLIENALLSAPDSPICVIAFARPDVHEKFPKLWEGAHVSELRLGELNRRATEALARDALGVAATPDVISRVVELAGGNAFYLEELIRGVATKQTTSLPSSVVAMSESRLDALETDLKRTLRAASIFGTTFWEGGVAALLGDAKPRAAEWLKNAEAMELVHRRDGSRFPEQQEYAFRHALLREAAHASLTDRDRALGHQLAASWLASNGETDPRVMTEHYERAGDRTHAIPYIVRLAELALKATDAEMVTSAANKAREMGATGVDLGRVELAAAEVAMWAGAKGVEHAVAAIDLLPEGEAPWLRAAATLAVLASRSGRHELHAPLRERMARVIAHTFPARSRSTLARPAHSGDVIAAGAQTAFAVTVAFHDAPDLFALLLPLRDSLAHEPFARAALEHAIFMRAVLSGRTRSRDIRALRDAVTPLDALGGTRVAHVYRANLAYAERMLGLLDDAERDFRTIADTVHLARARMFALHNLGLIAFMRDHHDEALRLETEALAIVGADVRIEVSIRVALARLSLTKGDAAAARVDIGPIDIANIPPQSAAIVLAVMSLIARATGDSSAVDIARRGAENASEGIDGESFVYATYAEALANAGRKEEARAAIAEASQKLRARAAALEEDGPTLLSLPDHARLIALARDLA